MVTARPHHEGPMTTQEGEKGKARRERYILNIAKIIQSYNPELLHGEGGRSPVPNRCRGNYYYTMPNPPNNWSGPT